MGWQQNKFTCCVVTGFGPIKSLRLHSLVGSPIRFSFKNHNFYKKKEKNILPWSNQDPGSHLEAVDLLLSFLKQIFKSMIRVSTEETQKSTGTR